MRVLVDTSAWVDFLNGYDSPARAALAELIDSEHDLCTCGLVVAEVFQGLRREKGRDELATLFRDLTFLDRPGIDLYFRAAALYRALRQRGETIRSTIDCVIVLIADDHQCAVLARDRDLDIILGSGLVSVGPWAGIRPSLS